ncbi:MAG TPA: SMC family ATPase [Micromonospora sp.]|nr:SMC family ATPase [Micromonospora sp.]
MRPLRLDLAGFTVFRDETTIDFTDADFFALVGPTGSGKSSLLDAICFALYGTVPRWGSSRGIANALAPSATEARVRLVFEAANDRYIATRVVRRDGRGNVKTAGAGLQLMPPGFDVSRLDSGLTPDDLGEVLAGTPAEMEPAVLDAVGLPYEQFTSCVVLPQGQFADFLHARPATRQQILVNLLGLGVYEEIQKQATARAVQAEAQLAAVDRLLGDLDDVGDEAVEAAEARLAQTRKLAAAVEAGVPELEAAEQKAAAASAELATLDGEIAELTAVRPPSEAATVAAAVATARAAVAEAQAAVTAAEELEEKVRGELSGAADPAALRLLLEAHTEHDRLVAQAEPLTAQVAAAEAEQNAAVTALQEARAAADRAAEELEAARRTYQEAQTADRAAALRTQLTAGQACPVCTQSVTTLPPSPAGSAVAAAEVAGQAARRAADAAQQRVAERDRAVRHLDRALERARAQQEQLTGRLTELADRLADSPGSAALCRELNNLDALRRRLDEAGTAVRSARQAYRTAQTEAEETEERVRAAWRQFDAARDRLARLDPPAADRDDLTTAWQQLSGWAAAEADQRRLRRDAAAATVSGAEAARTAAHDRLTALFTSAGLPVPTGQSGAASMPGDYLQAAAVAVERAEAEQRRLIERREQARRLGEQRAGHELDARTARALAGHLRANNFERWLLAEALDLLVDGASRILRELSAGQYELGHDKGEFFVVDHHDAGLRRGVRTLSGGETFQASLALALALSEQLAGLSTASASLESIVLDEGFGTLDAATLDTVAATLESLAARGDRMVGVVTHVPALAERIPVRFEVRKDARTAQVRRVG